MNCGGSTALLPNFVTFTSLSGPHSSTVQLRHVPKVSANSRTRVGPPGVGSRRALSPACARDLDTARRPSDTPAAAAATAGVATAPAGVATASAGVPAGVPTAVAAPVPAGGRPSAMTPVMTAATPAIVVAAVPGAPPALRRTRAPRHAPAPRGPRAGRAPRTRLRVHAPVGAPAGLLPLTQLRDQCHQQNGGGHHHDNADDHGIPLQSLFPTVTAPPGRPPVGASAAGTRPGVSGGCPCPKNVKAELRNSRAWRCLPGGRGDAAGRRAGRRDAADICQAPPRGAGWRA